MGAGRGGCADGEPGTVPGGPSKLSTGGCGTPVVEGGGVLLAPGVPGTTGVTWVTGIPGVAVGVPVLVGVLVGVGVGVPVVLTTGVPVGVGVADGVDEGVGVGVAVVLTTGTGVGVEPPENVFVIVQVCDSSRTIFTWPLASHAPLNVAV